MRVGDGVMYFHIQKAPSTWSLIMQARVRLFDWATVVIHPWAALWAAGGKAGVRRGAEGGR